MAVVCLSDCLSVTCLTISRQKNGRLEIGRKEAHDTGDP